MSEAPWDWFGLPSRNTSGIRPSDLSAITVGRPGPGASSEESKPEVLRGPERPHHQPVIAQREHGDLSASEGSCRFVRISQLSEGTSKFSRARRPCRLRAWPPSPASSPDGFVGRGRRRPLVFEYQTACSTHPPPSVRDRALKMTTPSLHRLGFSGGLRSRPTTPRTNPRS